MTTLKQRFAMLSAAIPHISQADLARATGAKPPSVNAWFSGETRSMKADTAAKAAALYGCSALWLATGTGEIWPPSITVESSATLSLSPAPSPGEPAIRVPLLANSGSMGPGSDTLHDDVILGEISLSEAWVSKRIQPTKPSALKFIHAYGDSMSPTFTDGDVLLVDTGVRDPSGIDGVYVLAANNRLYIKRVRTRMDNVTEVSSDNPTIKTVDVLNGSSSIDVLGRVVWCWNGTKL